MKETLSSKQNTAIKALIEHPTVKEAAGASGIPIRTMERWLTQPQFLEVLHQVQNDCFKDTGREVISSMPEALAAIKDIMRNPSQPGANTRLKAASMLLDQGAKYQKALELDERVKRLEEKAVIEDSTRIARLENYYNRKIIEDHRKSAGYDPLSSLNQIELEIAEKIEQHDPNKINLLTPEERLKYDKEYRDRSRLGLINKKREIFLTTKSEARDKETTRDKPRRKKPHQANKLQLSKEYGNGTTLVPFRGYVTDSSDNPESDTEGLTSFKLTDEDIMKWDPDNFDRIKQIREENQQREESEEDDENDQ